MELVKEGKRNKRQYNQTTGQKGATGVCVYVFGGNVLNNKTEEEGDR